MASRKIEVELVGDASSLNRALGQAQTKTSKFGAIAKTALVGGAAAGFYALGKAAKIGWDEFNAGQKVAAQTAAVLKSTGAVAGVTAQHVDELGEALMRKSGVDDEVIKSGENVLLTFTKIRNEAGKGNDIFDQTTKIALDMSTALGQDLQSSIIQVGKALQNPTVGLTALRRVGVSFTDQQTEMIKKLDESGHSLEAQKMVLAELTKEFGGSAEAAGKTFGGQIEILHQRLNNWLGDMTGKAIPVLQKFIKIIKPILADAMKTVSELTDTWSQSLRHLGDMLEKHRDSVSKAAAVLGVLVRVYKALVAIQLFWAKAIIAAELKTLSVILTVTDKIVAVVRWLGDNWHKVFSGMIQIVNALSGGALGTLISALERAYSVASKLFSILPGIGGGSPTPGPGSSGGRFGRTSGVAPRTSGVMHVHVNVGERELAAVLVDVDKLYRRANGGRPLLA